MKYPTLLLVALFYTMTSQANPDLSSQESTEKNKELARQFYDDLWFNNRTDQYTKYLSDTYTVHDIGDRKGVTEPAIRQKEIADFFWENGRLENQIDYQVAEGDLVVTRRTTRFHPETLKGRIAIGNTEISIINVFRYENGKIVEIWNHRHDIDTPQTLKFTIKGFFGGLLCGLIPLVIVRVFRRRQ